MQFEILLIAIVVSSACAIPGVFLVLRKEAMMSDAISHSILLGIVIAFIFVKNLVSPFLIIGAALSGVLVVFIVNLLKRTGLVKKDASIGLVFPLFFSIAVIIISRSFSNVHLDVDAVLLGEIAFAPLNRFVIAGFDIGPKSLIINGIVLLFNVSFLLVLFKELKISTFDPSLSSALGFSPVILNYILMADVSITAVTAFNAVGSILVVALIIIPPACSYFLTENLKYTIIFSIVIGMLSAVSGFFFARYFDVNIAGSIASISGLFFGVIFIFAPDKGVISKIVKRKRLRNRFYEIMMMIHIAHHTGSEEKLEECNVENIHYHLGWEKENTRTVIKNLLKKKFVESEYNILYLSDKGINAVKNAMTQDKIPYYTDPLANI